MRWEEDLAKEYRPTMRLRVWEERFAERSSRLQQWWGLVDDESDGMWIDIPVYGLVHGGDGTREERKD